MSFIGSMHKFDKSYDAELGLDSELGCCNGPAWWATPPADSLPAAYCTENTMHGLKYIAAPQRHLSERICWLISFVIGVAAAAYLINAVWDNYRRNPVIVSFMPMETEIRDIPFPAVTFCNMNRFPASVYEKIKSEINLSLFDPSSREEAEVKLHLLKNICGSSQSFSEKFNFSANRGAPAEDKTSASLNRSSTIRDLMNLITQELLPCDQLIRLCTWAQEVVNCSDIFTSIITEYGKCCTFNMVPIRLLKKVLLTDEIISDADVSTTSQIGPLEPELFEWMKWNFTKTGFKLEPTMKRPRRQTRAGIPSGLSVLLDPHLDSYYCPSTDSEGFRVALHSAVEFPPLQSDGKVVPIGKEVFLSVQPTMTISADEVRGFPYSKRQCYFPEEKSLEFYKIYTMTNCFDECIANTTATTCGCAQYYMPKGKGTRICSSDPNSTDFDCASKVQLNISQNYDIACKNCDSLCTEIHYSYEMTQADLQKNKVLWLDPQDKKKIPEWANNSMSILHIYFGMNAFVPQVRSQLYAPVDLIANTGGLLGLCLGFSALSAVEVVYFFTLRWFWQRIRRRTVGRRIANKFINAVRKISEKKKLPTTYTDRDRITPVAAAAEYPTHQLFWRQEAKTNNIIHHHEDHSSSGLPVLPAYSYTIPLEQHIHVLPLPERKGAPRRKKVLKGTFYRGPL